MHYILLAQIPQIYCAKLGLFLSILYADTYTETYVELKKKKEYDVTQQSL